MLVLLSYFLCAYRGLASLPKVALDGQHKLPVRTGKLLRRLAGAFFFKSIERVLHSMSRLHVVGGRVWIGGVVVVRIELAARYVLLEGRHRNRAWEFFAPVPDQIQASAEHRRERVVVLVPCSVEVAEEQ